MVHSTPLLMAHFKNHEAFHNIVMDLYMFQYSTWCNAMTYYYCSETILIWHLSLRHFPCLITVDWWENKCNFHAFHDTWFSCWRSDEFVWFNCFCMCSLNTRPTSHNAIFLISLLPILLSHCLYSFFWNLIN